MSDFLVRFNRRLPYPVRLIPVFLAGLLLYGSANSALATISKVRGNAPACSWRRTLLFGLDLMRLQSWQFRIRMLLSLKAHDDKLGIEQFSSGGRDFWIKTDKTAKKDGKETLTYLLAE